MATQKEFIQMYIKKQEARLGAFMGWSESELNVWIFESGYALLSLVIQNEAIENKVARRKQFWNRFRLALAEAVEQLERNNEQIEINSLVKQCKIFVVC